MMKYFLLFLCLVYLPALHAEPTKESLEKDLSQNPNNATALYNLGLLHYLENNYTDSIKYWNQLKKIEPTDWQLREKLIQAYWGANKPTLANKEITALRQARASGRHQDLAEKDFFICDQFEHQDIRVFVIEYYELKGQRPLSWKFLLKEGKADLDYYYSVGSYPSTTETAIALGEITKDERRYHLDGYWDNGKHATYNFYRNRPSYPTVKKEILKILGNQQKPLSESFPN